MRYLCDNNLSWNELFYVFRKQEYCVKQFYVHWHTIAYIYRSFFLLSLFPSFPSPLLFSLYVCLFTFPSLPFLSPALPHLSLQHLLPSPLQSIRFLIIILPGFETLSRSGSRAPRIGLVFSRSQASFTPFTSEQAGYPLPSPLEEQDGRLGWSCESGEAWPQGAAAPPCLTA